jgi:cobalt-zinc-cadmium efflux system outer membrane protein
VSFAVTPVRVTRPRRRAALAVALSAALLSSGGLAAAQSDARRTAPAGAPVAALLRDDRALAAWLAERSADVHAADARVAQAQADVGAARVLLPNPALDAALGGIPLGSGAFAGQSNVSLGLTQTVELGKRGPRVDAAELRAREATRSYDGALADKVSDARTALGRVAYLKARLTALEDNLAGAKKVSELQTARLEKGAISGNDLDRLLLDNLGLETDVARSRADYQGALAACQSLLQAPCEVGAAGVADVDAAAALPPGVGAAELQRRPDVEAARLEGDASEQDAVLARRKAIPDPTFRLGYYRDNTLGMGTSPNTLQLSVSIPLPLFDRGQHAEAHARARVVEQRHLGAALVAAAEGNLAALLARKSFLESAVHTVSTVAVPKSAGVLDAMVKSMDRGQVNMTDLLLARRTHVALVLGELDLRFEYFTVRSDLRHTLGLDTTGPRS